MADSGKLNSESAHVPAEAQIASPPGKPWSRLWWVGVWALLCIFFVPTVFFVVPNFGMESSWHLLMNKAFSAGWGFGQQLIWTYGPLGFLEWRIPYGLSVWYYIGFDLFMMLILIGFARDVTSLKPDRWLVLGCLVSLLIVKELISDLPSSAIYCLVICLLLRNLKKPALIALGALVLLSVVALLFKVNLGLASIVLCGLAFLFQAWASDKSAKLWLLVIVLQMALAWLLAWLWHVDLVIYIRNSLALVGQYSDGMVYGPEPGQFWHWVVCVFFAAHLILAGAAVLRHGFSEKRLLHLLIGGAAAFVLFKSAIVRSDLSHNKAFLLGFPVVALAFIVYGPEGLRSMWRLLFFGSVLCAGFLLFEEHRDQLATLNGESLKALLPVDYVKGLFQYHRQADWSAYVEHVEHLPGRPISKEARQLIGTNTVDVFPHEVTLILGSGLNYDARPLPQSYAVMNPALEARNLAFMQSRLAPRFVLFAMGRSAISPDDRYPLWDEPAVKRLLRDRYVPRLSFENLQGRVPKLSTTLVQLSTTLVLERNIEAAVSKTVALTSTRQRIDHEFTVPDFGGELYARITLRKTWLGRLTSFFYRGAPVRARFRLQDGSEEEYRIIPSNLESGVLVNYFVADESIPSAMNYLCRHSEGNPKCRAIQFQFARPWEFQPEMEISYFYLVSP